MSPFLAYINFLSEYKLYLSSKLDTHCQNLNSYGIKSMQHYLTIDSRFFFFSIYVYLAAFIFRQHAFDTIGFNHHIQTSFSHTHYHSLFKHLSPLFILKILKVQVGIELNTS